MEICASREKLLQEATGIRHERAYTVANKTVKVFAIITRNSVPNYFALIC